MAAAAEEARLAAAVAAAERDAAKAIAAAEIEAMRRQLESGMKVMKPPDSSCWLTSQSAAPAYVSVTFLATSSLP